MTNIERSKNDDEKWLSSFGGVGGPGKQSKNKEVENEQINVQ